MLYIRDNTPRAKTIISIFGVLIGLTLLDVISLIWQHKLLLDVEKQPLNIDMAKLEASDTIQRILGISSFITHILAIIYFIRWFRRAYYNLHQIPGTYPSFSEGWAAGSWFVPFLNLVRPYQIMKEIWDGTQKVITHRLTNIPSASLVGIWWAIYLISNIYSNITTRVVLQADDLGELITATRMELISDAIAIPDIVIAIVLITKTQIFEKELWMEAQTPSDSVFSLTADTAES